MVAALVAAVFLLAASASAQAPAKKQPPPAPKAAPAKAEADKPEAGKPEPAEPAKPAKIPLNLKNVSIDQIIKFLSDKTGKVVVKNKGVQAQITIVSPKPVTPEEAVELICQALRLDGVAVIEQDNLIKLVPASKLKEIGLETGVFTIKYADVTQMQKLIATVVGKDGKVAADPQSRKIVITAPAQILIHMRGLIKQLDVREERDIQVRIFQLRYADATAVAPILQAVLQDAPAKPSKSRPPSPKPGGPSRPAAKAPAAEGGVTVIAYPAANWIVISASREKLEAAADLIAKIDKEKPPELDLNVIPVKHAEALNLARQLTELFRRRPRTRKISDSVEITGDARSNALIVLSSPTNFELIKKIVAELDTEESRKTETRSYKLTYADAEDVAEQLNELYEERQAYYPWWWGGRRRRGGVETRFVPERRTNSLIVIAPPGEFEEIEALIKKLDEPISEAEVSPRIYHIKNIDAKEMTDVLNQIFGIEEESRTGGYWWYRMRGRERQVGRLYGKVRFVHEPSTNSIIVVTNNKENFPIIEALIRELDKTTPEYANTMVYELENADATDLADQLNSLFALPGAGRPAEKEEEEDGRRAYLSWLFGAPKKKDERPISNLIGKVRVVPDTRTNSLLITSAVQNFGVLRQLIKELDKESPKVLLKVQLVEVVRSRESRIGTRLSSDSSIFESEDFQNGFLGTFGLDWATVHHHTTLSADIDVSVLVQFLQRNFDAHVHSQPSIVVDNNKQATIFVGSEIPYLEQTQGEPGSTARNYSYGYKDVGTKLVIRPHINKNRNVMMSVNIEASQIRPGQLLFGGQITDKRTYETELAVEDAQTMVLGGILRQEKGETIHRVPILGHIPLLNLLFRKKDKIVTTTELIAFITPIVLSDRAAADRATEQQRGTLEGLKDLLAPK